MWRGVTATLAACWACIIIDTTIACCTTSEKRQDARRPWPMGVEGLGGKFKGDLAVTWTVSATSIDSDNSYTPFNKWIR